MCVVWLIGARSNMQMARWGEQTSMWADLVERVFEGGIHIDGALPWRT